ncbi:MAG TPA: hypothetical protein VLF43_04645 [Candidatus Saccharimonadales bacterium]|nr:hypothetical protein [Candidatus Saccharimonadales bacterium]
MSQAFEANQAFFTQFNNVSQETWGVPVYGEAAAQIAQRGIFGTDRGEYTTSSHVVDQNQLRDFAVSRGYEQHTLNGTLGKALDIIIYAGGLIPEGIDPEQTEVDEPFITLKALHKLAKDQGIGYGPMYELGLRIDYMTKEQIRLGQPVSKDAGELIIEGSLRTRKTYNKYTPESLAIGSLDVLTAKYEGHGIGKRVGTFLRNIQQIADIA